MASNSIKVVARFRPQNKIEIESGGEPIVSFQADDTCSIKSTEAAGDFTFDRVFGMASKQHEIFDYSIQPTVDDILKGYNGTVFAYGQTGAGKSFTMMGSDIDDDANKGIIPRIVEQIFASILASPGNMEYTVRVSYMEIYMERIRDLLAPQNDNLPVHEEKNRGVYVKGLLEIYVSSVQEVYEVMRRGGNARAVSSTQMNAESSRSHSIFVITVTQKNLETGSAKSGQLFLVDLAGSEKVGKTGASGQTLEEAKKINKSLSALGMVINALTDGKSSHVPYRDSKLTRILQESLGGNSRTTLIINCSPSSYNDAETLSTLRFGMRAKAIKNKAKVNAELSPAELKALLKKAQSQVTTFEEYISNLHDEVIQWRAGQPVPEDRWVAAIDIKPCRPAPPKERADTPSSTAVDRVANRRSETPSRPNSQMDFQRAGTPIALENDEKEQFLRRENELQDQIADNESRIAEMTRKMEALRANAGDKDELEALAKDLQMQLEKAIFEKKEALLTQDGLKEANGELTSELDELRHQLSDAKMTASESATVLDEKEKKKAERMARMMAGFSLGGDIFSDNERHIRRAIDTLSGLVDISNAGSMVGPDSLRDLKQSLLETQGIIRQAELSVTERADWDEEHARRREALEKRLKSTQDAYESLLERNLDESDVAEVKQRLSDAYASREDDEAEHLKTKVHELEQKLKSGGATVNGGEGVNGVAAINGNAIHQQISEFDAMKKSLMRDLQNRCERVVELEISLDETREQYNNVLRSSNNRAQQKKMAFLERNLEQLTVVQRQLVEQNSSLKREVSLAQRQLTARNERIQSLENMLQDSQEKLMTANHRFEAQLTAVKERLEAAKIGSTRSSGSPFSGGAVSMPFGSRIAKPLRGGGPTEGGPVAATANSEHTMKRNSWFFSPRT